MKNAALFFIVTLFLIAVTGCKKDESPSSPPSTDKIALGESVDAGSSTITASGGTITVARPGSPVDGLTITVPPHSFPGTRTFAISYAPITSHRFGPNFNPITPMITINNGGGYADSPMVVKIPVHIPQDQFAMVYFYNEDRQTLEALPLFDEDSTSITVGTLHFDPSTVSQSLSRKGGGASTQGVRNWGRMVVATMTLSEIYGRPLTASAYVVGQDDWEFINMGSYMSPDGICAGQSITSMWYYYEKHSVGAPQLSKQFDRVHYRPDSIWADNPRGYKFASMIQDDIDCGKWRDVLATMAAHPVLTYLAFASAIIQTGEPQLLAMDNSVSGDGHAMVVYAVDPSAGKLYVADPNYPGDNLQAVTYTGGRLGPYIGKLRADGTSMPFDRIGMFGVSAWIPFDKIAARYQQFENGTIGNDGFAKYRLVMTTEGNVDAPDTVTTRNSNISFSVSSTDPNLQNITGYVYNEFGAPVITAGGIRLKPGWNTIGIQVMGQRKAPWPTKWTWLDWRWIAVYRSAFVIETTRPDGAPLTVPGYRDTMYTFRCNSNGAFPTHPRLEWNFGDGSGVFKKYGDTTYKRMYSNLGTYRISVNVYDDDKPGSLPVGRDTETVSIVAVPSGLHGVLDSTVNIGTYHLKLKFTNTWNITGGNLRLMGPPPSYTVDVAQNVPVHLEMTLTASVVPAVYYDTVSSIRTYKYTASTPYFPGRDTSWFISQTAVFPYTVAINGYTMTADLTFTRYDQTAWLKGVLMVTVRRDCIENGSIIGTSYFNVAVGADGGMGAFMLEAP